jgi:hypothetical protein
MQKIPELYMDKWIALLEQYELEQAKLPCMKRKVVPMGTPDQLAFNVLAEMLLPSDFYTAMPLGRDQTNTEMLLAILWRHSKRFRKIVKAKRKENGYHAE